ncbi:MAG: AmmeMemoRadiSam system protein B, partial [Candidatus Zixiibacteriota bacterium]
MAQKTILFGAFLSLIMCYGSAPYAEERASAVAGTFYPDNPATLQNMVRGHLRSAGDPVPIDGQIIALIVPHAGLVYSGQIAAHGYRLLEDSGIDKVILCGPSHRYRFSGLSVYGPGVSWKNPLGAVSCNDRICQSLLDYSKSVNVIPEAHRQEHCLEVQLPYLQTVLKDFTIVPVAMGQPDQGTVDLLANALGALETDSTTVMIASTDWQHYHPAEIGWKLDSLGLACLERLDPDR